MADAPSTGGGGWGSFEIFLIAILALGLLSSLTGKKITPLISTTDTTEESIETRSTTDTMCGLSIIAPLSLESVNTSVHLAGSVQGCNWIPSGQTALFAQVVNGGGMPVSDFVAVQQKEDTAFMSEFDTTITISGTPSGTGYLLLTPATPPEKPFSVRIPLRFVRK